jgi:hypothetical protein
MNKPNTIDSIAMYLGGGLILFGVVGIGLLEMIAGAPHPVSGEGQIQHDALVPLEIRSYIIMAGLLIWGLVAIARVFATEPPSEPPETTRTPGAD